MIITQTPFRMSFFGGGTDMEKFFKEHGGAVLSTTFDKYCYVNVRHLPRFFDYSTELSYSKTERVTDINDIQHPAIRNAMKMLDMHEIRLTYEADLPARSGLGTSSSFAVGMLNAFYRAHKRVTVFSLRNCAHYKYDALEGTGHHIEEEEFDEYEWHIRLVLEGEDRIFMNYEIIQGKWMPSREDREYKEEILEGVDEAVSTLERMISEERVEELLSTLTDLQRKVVHTHLFHGLSFTEAAKHLGMTRQNLTGIYNAAIYKIQKKHFRALCSC